jgi:hypothetical protein
MVILPVPRATNIKMAVFWVAVPCSLVEFGRRFRHAYCLHHQDDNSCLMVLMEAANKPVTSASFYETIPSSALKIKTICSSESLASTDKSTWRKNRHHRHRHRREISKPYRAEDILFNCMKEKPKIFLFSSEKQSAIRSCCTRAVTSRRTPICWDGNARQLCSGSP